MSVELPVPDRRVPSGLKVPKQVFLDRGLMIASILLLRFALDAAYLWIISPVFSYQGLITDIEFTKVLESYVLTLLLAFVTPIRAVYPSDILISLLLINPVLSMFSLYALMNADRTYVYMVAFCFGLVLVVRRIKLPRPKPFPSGSRLVVAFAVITVLVALAVIVSRGGLQYFNLDLTKVYEFRSEVSETVLLGSVAYLGTWTFKVLNPALIAFAVWQRRYFAMGFFIGLQVLFFATSSHKAVLFYVPLIIGGMILFRLRKPIHAVVAGVTFVVAMAGSLTYLTGDMMPASLLIRRVFFVPAHLNFAYHDFFSRNQFVFLTNTKLGNMLRMDYPYDLPPPRLVSLFLQGHENTWMNTGFLATSYMHAGYFGMIIFSIVVGLLLALVDAVSRGRLPTWLASVIVLVPFNTLYTSADLPTALMTHGLALAVLLLWLLGSSPSSKSRLMRGISS